MLMAGLFGSSRCVSVVPPLFASGTSPGESGLAVVPDKFPLPESLTSVASPIRLKVARDRPIKADVGLINTRRVAGNDQVRHQKLATRIAVGRPENSTACSGRVVCNRRAV